VLDHHVDEFDLRRSCGAGSDEFPERLSDRDTIKAN
jgi:hypothetical protein